ncbi:MAG TPA: tungsten formylmethanofuran dehydrogenase [Flavobacteriales bacterium]|nr:tungsten formylmethanofuran dehydrogenase [Flavobacteriales bacterium]
MSTSRAMADLFESHAKLTSKYVHACSNGHEAIQIAAGLQLQPQDYLYAYYRDDAMLLALGMTPEELMLQLFAKADDPFSGGRTYYGHPSLKRSGKPRIPHNSSATGMQAIPATGAALGLQYREDQNLGQEVVGSHPPVVLCSIGDAAMTEGEVSEALHMATLRQLPIIYLVQDNEWDISAHSSEIRFGDATTMAQAFPGLDVRSVNGHDYAASCEAMAWAFRTVREERRPVLVHAKVPLLGHHTSGVRREWYRDDLDEAQTRDPLPHLQAALLNDKVDQAVLQEIIEDSRALVQDAFDQARVAKEPDATELMLTAMAPSEVTEETGQRQGADLEPQLMVDQALHAMQEILSADPHTLLYGQDVGGRLGGVFREAATLAQKFGDERVFNTPIQEAFIVGSTVGMSAVGLKPIVEIQFADYLWPGLNQLFTELSRSHFLSNGQWPVNSVIRVPIGAYGSGGPYHSSSIESVLTAIRGIKVAYPSCGADLKGLLKAAVLDPNPVVVLEHKGLYWSKVPGTESAKTAEPDSDYILPLGIANTVLSADDNAHSKVAIITYGRGVHWALEAAKDHPGSIEILDLRSVSPVDYEAILEATQRCHRCLVLTEEPPLCSFAQSLAGYIADHGFEHLDAPVRCLGSMEVPAIPLNSDLEAAVLPNAQQVSQACKALLNY